MSDPFSALAAGYARYRPGYPPELFAYLASLPAGRRLAWDVATGNGQAALGLAGHFERVEATDRSAAQIERAAPHPRVAYRVAPAEASGLADRAVDLVTVAQALHWLDFDRFYREVERVLAPGGAVAAWCYNLLDVGPRVNAVVGRLYGQVVGPFWPPERRLLEAGYRNVPFPFEETAPPRFAMRTAWRLADLVGYLGTWSAAARYRAARGEDPVALVAPDLAAAWGDPEAGKEVRWPLHLRVGRRRGPPAAQSAR
jgi:SAM-dependent methyltransferase